jgi:thermitase
MKANSKLAVFVGVLSASGILQAAPPTVQGKPDFAKGRILIEAKAGLSPEKLQKILGLHGGKGRKIGQSNIHVVDLAAHGSEKAIVEKLAHHPDLKFAELDMKIQNTSLSNDPLLGNQWHIPKVNAPLAWDSAQGAGITIAILDSGVDPTHPDLVANLVPGYNSYDGNTDTSDVCGHGTAVAGVAAARGNNSIGVAGIAHQAKIMPVRIAYRDATNGGCWAYYSTISSGLTYAADHGAKVANISYGGVATSASVQSVAQYFKSKGGLVFVSAGNDGLENLGASTTSLIVVSATGSDDGKTSWSSFGNFVSLTAPGSGIWTTSNGSNYGGWNGTSFSSPLAAGVAALMMSARPAFDGSQVEKLLFSSAIDLGATGKDIYYGHGMVDAAAGVNAVMSATNTADTQAPTVALASPLDGSTVSGQVAVNVSASDNVGVTQVELKVNGNRVAIDNSSPFAFSWDSKSVVNGIVTLTSVAYDAAGNARVSAPINVSVNNAIVVPAPDTIAPVATIASPVAGVISGNVSIQAFASDNNGPAGISLTILVDGALKAKGTGGSLAYNWNTRKESKGSHKIDVVAKDAAGNSSTTSVLVTK